MLQHELQRGEQACCEVREPCSMLIRTGVAATGNQWRQYSFDACLPAELSQKQVFQESGVINILDSAIEGYSGTVLAYGQTGSGKTHSILGRMSQGSENGLQGEEVKRDDGLVMRSAKRLFRQICGEGAPSDVGFSVSASFTEIYNAPGAVNECISDLLNPGVGQLHVRYSQRQGFFVSDLRTIPCRSAADVRAVLEAGLQNRRVGATNVNQDSSRSHALFTLRIDSDKTQADGSELIRRYGKVTFVDLAGSERLKESLAEVNRAKETQAINKSIFTLGKVISQLAQGKHERHIPYRDSKLTQLLQESFGGGAICLMVTCISPCANHAEESMNSLNYAHKAMNIRNRPVVRLDEQQQIVRDLRTDNASLKRELEVYRSHFGLLSPRLESRSKELVSADAMGSATGQPAGVEQESHSSANIPAQKGLVENDSGSTPRHAPDGLLPSAKAQPTEVEQPSRTPVKVRRSRSSRPGVKDRSKDHKENRDETAERGRSVPPIRSEPGFTENACSVLPSPLSPKSSVRQQFPVGGSSSNKGSDVSEGYAMAAQRRRQQIPQRRRSGPANVQSASKLPPIPRYRSSGSNAPSSSATSQVEFECPPRHGSGFLVVQNSISGAPDKPVPVPVPGAVHADRPHKGAVIRATMDPVVCTTPTMVSEVDMSPVPRVRNVAPVPVVLSGSGKKSSISPLDEEGTSSVFSSAQIQHLEGSQWADWKFDFRKSLSQVPNETSRLDRQQTDRDRGSVGTRSGTWRASSRSSWSSCTSSSFTDAPSTCWNDHDAPTDAQPEASWGRSQGILRDAIGEYA